MMTRLKDFNAEDFDTDTAPGRMDFFKKNWELGGFAHRLCVAGIFFGLLSLLGFIGALVGFVWVHEAEILGDFMQDLMLTATIVGVPAWVVGIVLAFYIEEESEWHH